MNIAEMFDRVLLKSGQYILPKTKVEIDEDRFRFLVEDAIAEYSKTNPYHATKNVEIIAPRQYNFSTHPFSEDVDLPLGVPDWISECTPIKFAGVSITAFNMQQYAMRNSTLIDPIEAPWDWNKPILTVPYSSKYKLVGVFKHRIIRTQPDPQNPAVYEVKTITYEDHLFFDLLQGLFLQGIGRSRRSFTMNDLPITMDADQIASDGKELVEATREKLAQQSKFWLAMG